MKIKPSNLLLLALLSLATTMLNGCASTKASPNTVGMLSQAGFVIREPKTPEQKQIYAHLPSYKLESLQVKGQMVYVYKDDAAKRAWVGHEAEYHRYRQIAREDRLAGGHSTAEMAERWQFQDQYGGSGSDWW